MEKLTFAGLFSYAEESTVLLSKRAVIVGPNNAGKSNLFRIIRILANALYRGERNLQASEMSQSAVKSHIKAEIFLSSAEVDILVDYFACGKGDNNAGLQMIRMPNRKSIADSSGSITIKVEWKRMQDGSGGDPYIEIQFPKCGFKCGGNLGPDYFKIGPLGEGPYTDHSDPAQFNKFIARIFKDNDPMEGSAAFFRGSGGVAHRAVEFMTTSSRWRNSKSRSKIQDLMNYLGANDGTTVSLPRMLGTILEKGIVHATENRNLVQDKDAETFQNLSLFGKRLEDFESGYNRALMDQIQAHSLSHANALEDDGSNIARFLFNLKNSPRRSETKRYKTIKEQFERLFRSQKLTIESILERYTIDKPMAGIREVSRPSIVVVDKKLPEHLPLAHVGSGARNVIYMLAAVYGTKNSIVMLDEPGINMHPTMLQAVMEGMVGQNSDNQLLVVTHSPDLLRNEAIREKAEIICVRNTRGQSKICQDEATARQGNNDLREIGRLIDPGVFFARRAILVEGESDRVVLGFAEDMAAKDPKYNLPLNDIAVVGVNGDGNFKKYRELLHKYCIPLVILADGDTLGRTFEDKEVSWISKSGVKGKGPIYLIRGKLEVFMKELDPDIFAKANRGGKICVANKFVNMMREKNPDHVPPSIVEFLDRCVK